MRVKPVILHLLPWELSCGGAQRFVVDLAEWASPFADVHIVCPSYRGFWSAPAKLHHPQSVAEGAELIRDLSPDLIHHHGPLTNWLVSCSAGYPRVGTCHDWATQHACNYDWVVPICGNYPNKVLHGVDLSKYRPKQHTNDHTITVGIVGRRSPDRISETLLQYLEKHGIPDGIRLRQIGHGLSYRAEETAARLRAAGAEVFDDVPAEQMPAVYQNLDVLLNAPTRESCGYAQIEAMASGLPIVARSVEANPDIVGDGGIVAPDEASLFAALELLRDDPLQRRDLGERARARAEARHDIRAMLAAYNEVYRQRTNGLVRQPDSAIQASVVIPIYNTKPQWVFESVESVLNQEDVTTEIILVDDGSTDPDTVDTIQNYDGATVNGHAIRVLRQDNAGISKALNTGIQAARSDLIVRHDSDDLMPPGRLQTQINYHRQHPSVVLTSGQMTLLDSDGNITHSQTPKKKSNKPYWDTEWYLSGIAHPTVAISRYAVLKAGGYPTDQPSEDTELWCALELAGWDYEILPETFVYYRIHSGQLTHDPACRQRDKEIRERYRQLLCCGLAASLLRFASASKPKRVLLEELRLQYKLIGPPLPYLRIGKQSTQYTQRVLCAGRAREIKFQVDDERTRQERAYLI